MLYCSLRLFNWKFIPAYSPHFGGIWEAGVKSAKFHLKRVLGNALLTFEELSTALAQITAILNSRPLTPLSTHSLDLPPLTPSHLLVGRPLNAVPDPDLTHLPQNHLSRYQYIQKLQQDFWARWSKEYVSELQCRSKWKSHMHNVRKGTLVLIKNDNSPSMQWKTGIITETHPGTDGVVRVVSLRTNNGTIKRAQLLGSAPFQLNPLMLRLKSSHHPQIIHCTSLFAIVKHQMH